MRPLFHLLAALLLAACADYEVPLFKKMGAVGITDTAGVDKKSGAQATSQDDALYQREKTRMDAEAAAVDYAISQAPSNSLDLMFLLSMSYEEAVSISKESMELPGAEVRLAADEIEVLKKDRAGRPSRVRAKGRVYLESGTGEDITKVLCQEAYVSSTEVVLRGKPIIQRGKSTIEGLADETVAYMLGWRLRVIGLHRLTNQTALAGLPDLGPWTGGPNPILPPLTEAAVPGDIREQMLKAAEAEAVLQQNKADAMNLQNLPAAPWVKPEPAAKSGAEPGKR
ncbi:MAG: hypothetical protein LDL31_11680 [Prosthecobacter sp.]|jgi:hypothetical protein|nr:hypothetical protein [Prosthecobacter sp.]